MNHKLPSSAYIIAVLSLLVLWGVNVIGKQQAALDARPATTDWRVDDRTEDVRRGPSETTRRVVFDAVTGKKISSETVKKTGPVESHTEIASEAKHTETPVPAARSRSRYVGVGIDPLDYARLPRLRAGMTVFSVLDLGVAYDSRFAPTSGAFGLEAAYRF